MTNKYIAIAGLYEPHRFVFIEARTKDEAILLASSMLDKQCDYEGKEPPVSWDIVIYKVTE